MCSAMMSIFEKRKTEIDCWAMPAITHPTRRPPSHSVSLVCLIADSPITFTAECKCPINPVHLMLMFLRRSLLGAVMGDTGPVVQAASR